MVKIIYTRKNEEILVDDEDYGLLSRHSWDINNSGYARTSLATTHVLMHKLIHPTKAGLVTDHINRNKLDNRKENLRTASKAQNTYNYTGRKNETNTSKYLGVFKKKDYDWFYGSLSYHNHTFYIKKGTEEDTAIRRDYICYQLRDEFVVLNFPENDYENFKHPQKEYLDKLVKKIKSKGGD